MDDDSLAKQLSHLRFRAGNPSLRVLEKLTERQGRRMSRASIQDKFSGSSALKLVHVLALVQACADYARSIGAPLRPEDVDEKTWQKRMAQPLVLRRVPISVENMGGNASQQQTPTPEVALLITPLINAGMEDIARIAAEGANRPIEKWLPTVVAALGQAQMDFQGFLQLAAHATAAQTVKILDSIATAEEGDAVSEMYFQMCVLTKQPAEIPKLLVALRRHDGEASFRYAQTFIDAIVGKGGWPGRTRPDLADILRALRAASLKDDADSLAKGIGRYSRPKITLATAAAFPDSFLGDRELILFAVSQGGIDRLLQVIACLEKEEIPGVNSPEVLEFILPSVHESERADLSRALNDAGIRHVAKRLLDLSREVP